MDTSSNTSPKTAQVEQMKHMPAGMLNAESLLNPNPYTLNSVLLSCFFGVVQLSSSVRKSSLSLSTHSAASLRPQCRPQSRCPQSLQRLLLPSPFKARLSKRNSPVKGRRLRLTACLRYVGSSTFHHWRDAGRNERQALKQLEANGCL